jgi:thymidine phosphorylase
VTGDRPGSAGGPHRLRARRLGIDTLSEIVVFLRKDCPVCRSEGFATHSRVLLRAGETQLVATLYHVTGGILDMCDAGLSESAWLRLGLNEGDEVIAAHPEPLGSFSLVRSRIYGNRLDDRAFAAIIGDIVEGDYSDNHISSFLTACAANPLDRDEILGLTRAMVNAGERLAWNRPVVADKHSVGGLPGNRTTPIVVSILAALGMTMPKTSSRAITSPAGTADMMETLAPVDLDIAAIHRVVDSEGGCVAWGGAVRLSPADDILIRVERALDLDAEGQMIASVLSKKIAAGATHLVIDMPVGPTAKVRNERAAQSLSAGLLAVGDAFGIRMRIVPGDGSQPIGRGIGPALEARDVLCVLRRSEDAPADLRDRAVQLAGALIELTGLKPSDGAALAAQVLADGRAWEKFQRICAAQGGMRTPPAAGHRHPLLAQRSGQLAAIDNRKIAKLAKLAGAPDAKAAGVDLHVRLGDIAVAGQPLCTVHAEAPGELDYALTYAEANADIFRIEDF